ncbi:carbonic anhydrase [Methanonatronarchaeum sp. AMET6-2]|uniref:carbonic anhydrase n=1 Tax=Methanonatronarchaeum sp. AMET6-2 TaxID=2933293 RepID=UPI0012127D8D|nr:carbonic anhydrase [Methanonatronarchaeum sp. AMET6-2]RZN61741.1 MAG: hypothetical protein EF811_04760 [Methanonatronarchaeia archaeon]UOY10102.1 hypothetical protein MU439_00225 [Methanonatronarchaeum sp. AMET6-2]
MDYIKLKKDHNAQNIDMLTIPAPSKIIAENKDKPKIQTIKEELKISTQKHNSNLIAIIAHHDCAGTTKNKKGQIKDTKKAIKTIKKWGYNTKTIGLWVDKNWQAHKIK